LRELDLGVFFCKVIKEGTIAPGDTLVVGSRPRPEWPLARVSKVFYGGDNARTCNLDKFQGTEEELHQLLQLEELALFEWRDRLETFVQKRAAERKKKSRYDLQKITFELMVRGSLCCAGSCSVLVYEIVLNVSPRRFGLCWTLLR